MSNSKRHLKTQPTFSALSSPRRSGSARATAAMNLRLERTPRASNWDANSDLSPPTNHPKPSDTLRDRARIRDSERTGRQGHAQRDEEEENGMGSLWRRSPGRNDVAVAVVAAMRGRIRRLNIKRDKKFGFGLRTFSLSSSSFLGSFFLLILSSQMIFFFVMLFSFSFSLCK